jgi:hypothetical protein
MKYLLFAVVIGFPALAVADLAPWSSHRAYRAQLETLYRCQWLTATAEEEQQQQKKKGEAGKDDEPDCE